ncbi:MAG: CotH kinase family protein, partial [archaeon]
MRLKKREEDKFFYYLKKILREIYKKIKSKKVKIFFCCLVAITLLTMGTFVGLIASGFFGTLDKPSERGLNIVHELNIPNLRLIKIQIRGIMAENIKIPFNYIKGQFSKPEKIYINIAFEDVKKIEYQRKKALEKGLLVSSEEDYVPATISYGDKQVNVKLRLKGDVIDHISGNKWSFRIKVAGDETLFGMKTFSIQKPEIRNYLDEFVYHKTLKKEGVMSIRYDFIEVNINGENKGIYAIEEHFDTQLIENNQRREGVIVRFEDNVFHEEVLRIYALNTNTDIDQLLKETFYLSNIETFYSNEKTLEDPELARQFIRAKDLLESFRNGVLKTHEVFDVEKLSKYFAVSTLMVAEQAASFDDTRFYYNPITDHIEPIGFNALPNMDEVEGALEVFIPSYFGENNFSEENKKLSDLIFEDEIFYKSYIKELERVSQKDYLDALFLELDEGIQKNINILHKDYPFYHFPKETYYQNQEVLKSKLNPVKSLNAFLQETSPTQNKIILSVANTNLFPLEIVNLAYNNSVIFKLNQENNILKPRSSETLNYEKFEFRIPSDFNWDTNSGFLLQVNYKIYGLENELNETVSPWPYTEENFLEKDFLRPGSVLNYSDFIEINEDKKIISIKQGQWILDQSMIIPEGFTFKMNGGTTLNLINSATIVSYSGLQFLGTEATPIKIISSDGTGQGLAVLNAGG